MCVVHANARESRNSFASVLIFGILVLDLIAFTSILPLFPSLIDFYGSEGRRDWLYDAIEKFCSLFENFYNASSSKQLNAVFFGGALGSLYCILQFVSSPFLGALSDVYGRKPILLLSVCGSLVSYAIWMYARTFSCFVLSRVVGGLSKASVLICTTIMADIYPQETVGKGMAIVGSTFSVGFLVGPMFGVYFSRSQQGEDFAFASSAKFAIILTVIEIFVILIFLSETLSDARRKSQFQSVLQNVSLYVKPNALFTFKAIADRCSKAERMRMQQYGKIYFMYLFLYSGLEFTLPFLTHTRFNYDRMQQGKIFVFIGILMIIMQGCVVRRIPIYRQHKAATYGILITIPAYVTVGYSSRVEVLYAGVALYAVASSLVVPCMTSCVSNLADMDFKGTTIGVFRCLGALARAFGPFSMSTVFWLFGSTFCYLFGGFLLVIPFAMLQRTSTLLIKKSD